jgi:glycosyltransferase involved in cell wall biosynthesis
MTKVLIIGKTWPEPKTTGAGVRMMQLIDVFKNKGFEVIFCAAAAKTEYSESLSTISTYTIKINDDEFNTLLTNLSPKVVIFDRFHTEEQFGWRVHEVLPEALTILDTEDLHLLRYARQQLVKKKRCPYSENEELDEIFKHEITFRELAAIHRCDMTLVISTYEMELLKKLKVPIELLTWLPMNSSLPSLANPNINFSTQKHFVFFGNYLHEPNKDALLCINELFPSIRKFIHGAEIHIYGAYLPNNCIPKQHTGIFYHGWCENIQQVLSSARVLIAPLRFGAGIKSKIIEAMRNGTPVATTRIGTEGIADKANFPGVVGDLDDTWIQETISLYQSEEKWKSASTCALKAFEYWQLVCKKADDVFVHKLDALIQTLENHRNKNITRKILHLEQLKSYKYLSKYIIEKNKRRSN